LKSGTAEVVMMFGPAEKTSIFNDWVVIEYVRSMVEWLLIITSPQTGGLNNQSAMTKSCNTHIVMYWCAQSVQTDFNDI